MESYVLSMETAADVSREYLESRNISSLSFHYSLADKLYTDDFGETLSIRDFYEAMRQGEMTRTSQIPNGEYEAYFRSFLEKGLDVIHVCLSSGLSGTYNGACMVAEQLREEFPDRKLFVIDSLCASSGIGLLVDQMANERDAGCSIEVLNEYALKTRYLVELWFFSGDLTYFIRGGRISKTAGTIGNMLHIEPLMSVGADGKLKVRKKIRGKKKTLAASLEMVQKYGDAEQKTIFISNADCLEDAKMLAGMLEEAYPSVQIHHFDIGTTIGSHTGPGTVAFFFMGKDRREVELDFNN
ncbi:MULTISPECIES: DegV family protein [Terrabacteria group]|uniref:DegV family protein n=1 Tax=Bacillati TaxID=1783272 RepID=UPI00193936D8|nr:MULTISPECIES: DegV family protein [Terrabacteria group]MBW9212086.1 DegV family protein [Trueperella sp. zg.1013]QRG87108.1 DegV family protein [Bulleidia sp. zg-1006]